MALLPSYTMPDSDWSSATMPGTLDTTQYGFAKDSPTRIYTQEQVWTHDPNRVRFGNFGVQCNGWRNSYNMPNHHGDLDMSVVWQMGNGAVTGAGVMLEGDEEWVGMSYWFPSTYVGTASWGIIYEWASGASSRHPRYGTGWDVKDPNLFKWHIANGHHPSPGDPSGNFNPTPPNGYLADEAFLGTGAPRPFTKEVWHDFYYHIVYNARTNGVAEVWHREEGAGFEKLYSNKNDGTALINRAPHPTWYYNDLYGAPGEGTTAGAHVLSHRMYRSDGPNDANHDVIYWMDGPFRRQSESEILSVFDAADPNAPTITSFTPTSGPVTTVVTITGTNF